MKLSKSSYLVCFLLLLFLCSFHFPDKFYEQHNLDTFQRLPEIHQEMNITHVDVDLLNAAIFYATNEQRKKHRLPVFKFSKILRNAAMYHSKAMVKKQFFNHISSERKNRTPYDRIINQGLSKDKTVGENIGYYFGYDYKPGKLYKPAIKNGIQFFYLKNNKQIRKHTYWSFAQYSVREWMHSPGHRKNILNKGYSYLGCGVVLDSQLKPTELPMFKLTQNFSD